MLLNYREFYYDIDYRSQISRNREDFRQMKISVPEKLLKETHN